MDLINVSSGGDHLIQTGLNNTVKGAPPSGVGGTDNALLRISKQEWGTISGQDGQQDAALSGNLGVGLGWAGPGVGVSGNGGGAMDLMQEAAPVDLFTQGLDDSLAIDGHRLGVILYLLAQIQAGAVALADATVPRAEKRDDSRQCLVIFCHQEWNCLLRFSRLGWHTVGLYFHEPIFLAPGT